MTVYSVTIGPGDLPAGAYTFEIVATDNSANQNVAGTTPINFAVAGTTTNSGSSPGSRPTIEVDIAFGFPPFSQPRDADWIDVTNDVLMSSQVTITRGATADNPQPTPGTISFTLKDQSRKYDPENAAGPYYGQFTYGSPCRVLAHYANLPVPIVTSNPISSGNPIVSAGVTSVPLGYGYIDGFPQSYTGPLEGDRYVAIPIVAPDALSVLARTSFMPVKAFTVAPDLPPEGVPISSSTPIVTSNPIVPLGTWPDYMRADLAIVGDPDPILITQLSGDRIQKLCELAGIPDSFLNIDAGQTLVEGGVPQETNLLDHFRTITATEYGRLYQQPDGTLRFLERRSSETRLRRPKNTFTEIGNGGVPYATLSLDPADRRFLINRAVRGSQSVAQVMAQDDISIAQYGVFEDSQTYAFASAEDAVAQAHYVVQTRAQPPARINQLIIKPDRDPATMFAPILQLDLGDWQLVSRTPMGIGDPITKTVTVEQVSHQFDQKLWTTTVDLGEADTARYFTADDPVLGLVDAGNVAAY